MNDRNTDSTWQPSDPFEQLLAACQPSGGNQLEQMLYQAGWQAALAQADQVTELADRFQVGHGTNKTKPNRTALKNSMKWYGSGLGTGLAVGLMGAVLALKITASVQPSALSQSGPTVEARSATASSQTVEATKSVNPNSDSAIDTSSRKPFFGPQVSSLFAWNDLFVNPARDWDGRLPVSRANVRRGDIEWDALPNKDRYLDAHWQNVPGSESSDNPPSKALFYRPLTESQINELL